MAATSLEATFLGPRIVRLGEPVSLAFRLANPLAVPLLVLARGTPLEGLLGPYLQVRCEGELLPYDGIMVKRGPISAAEYVRIDAGGAVTRTLEIHRAYAVRRVGRYRVDYLGTIPDHLPADEAVSPEERVARLREGTTPDSLLVHAESWTFEVVPGAKPLLTEGARARGETV